MSERLSLADPEATEAAGRRLAATVQQQRPPLCVVYLRGELGAGKTTFVRGLLRGLGHAGRVPSPTYTLVEPYELAGYHVAHLDLYRLSDSAELEFLALPELLEPPALLLIEWPERGTGHLPPCSLDIELTMSGLGRQLQVRGTDSSSNALCAAWLAQSAARGL